MTLDTEPADVGCSRREPRSAAGSLSISWRGRTCRVALHGPVTTLSLDHLTELVVGVGPAGKRVLISLADAVVTREIRTELSTLSQRLSAAGAILEFQFVPRQAS